MLARSNLQNCTLLSILFPAHHVNGKVITLAVNLSITPSRMPAKMEKQTFLDAHYSHIIRIIKKSLKPENNYVFL
jgi:hypothetical protein